MRVSRAKHSHRAPASLIEPRDGSLAGLPCFIIGGGPSLATLNLLALESAGVPRLAVNAAFTKGADAVLLGDSRVRRELIQQDPRLREAWERFSGTKWFVRYEQEAVKPEDFPEMKFLPARQAWGRNLEDGLVTCVGMKGGTNTGLSAINLVDILGASTIYLLGFDLKVLPLDEDDAKCARDEKLPVAYHRTKNWHSLYPSSWRTNAQDVYPEMIRNFEAWAQAPRARVFNCNPESALRCFPFVEYEFALSEASAIMAAHRRQ